MSEKRRKIWIDGFQTRLALRIAFYFIFYQVAIWSLVMIERNIFIALDDILGREAAGNVLLLLGGVVVLIGCLFVYEAIKFSHRLVGPLVRFRKVVKAITAGEELTTIQLRKGDYLQDLKDEFNEMLKVLEARGAIVIKHSAARQEEPAPLVQEPRLSGVKS